MWYISKGTRGSKESSTCKVFLLQKIKSRIDLQLLEIWFNLKKLFEAQISGMQEIWTLKTKI